MRKPVMYAAIALFAASIGGASASNANSSQGTSRTGVMETAQFKRQIDALGYDLRSLKRDDGVFNTRIVDRQSRLSVKAKFDAVSGELLRAAPGH